MKERQNKICRFGDMITFESVKWKLIFRQSLIENFKTIVYIDEVK